MAALPPVPAGYGDAPQNAAAGPPPVPQGYGDEPSDDPSWGDVASGAATNFLPSAGNVIKNTVTPFLDLPGTAKSLGKLGGGVI